MFPVPGTRRAGRGCKGGFEDLEASLCCIRFLVLFLSDWSAHTLTDTHRIRKSSAVLPAKLVSPFIAGCRCLWVKYLWKIAMIGFIMLPAVSSDGNEFGILGWEKKPLFSKYHLVRAKEERLPVFTAWWAYEYISWWPWDNDELF